MGQRQTVEIRIDTRQSGVTSTLLPEQRPYIVELKGSINKTYYLANAEEVRNLMVPWGELKFGEHVPGNVTPQRYV